MPDAAKMVDAVLAAIDRPMRRLADRIAALEARPAPERGEKGERGEEGQKGECGPPGRDGREGRDGLGFDDLAVDYDGVRGFVIRFGQGNNCKEFPFSVPVMVYRQSWDEHASYETGDVVSSGGSMWHCNMATTERPDEGVAAWTRAVRRGRDGRNGKDGARGEKGDPGIEGRAGRDLTQMAPDGSKW